MKTSIINISNRRSVAKPGMFYSNKSFAIYVDDKGFLSLDGKNVYTPQSGRKALKALAENGIDNFFFIDL